jgi:hypothetical protein
VRAGLWRAILGWFLVVAGILVVLLGAAAIGGSYLPDAQDPVSTRIAGAVIIAIGLGLAGGGIRLIKSRPRVARAPKLPRPPRRLTKVHLVGSAAALLLVAAGAVGAFIYSFFLDAEVQSLHSAHQCTTAANADCYELHNVTITGVDISNGRGGETDEVHFTDSGSEHEVAILPGGLDSSVLSTGAEGAATLWHGKYTNLKVAGVSFATIDNPAGQRGEWRLIGIILLGAVLFQGAVLTAGVLYVRRRREAQSMDQGGLRGSAELMPPSAVATTGYSILPLVLHPSLRKSRLLVWLIALPLGLAAEFAYFAQYGAVLRWTIGVASALLIVAGVVWQLVFLPRTAIYVDEISFGTVSGLGRRRSWARGEAARVVLRTLDRGQRTPPLPLAIVVGPDGRARMKFSAGLYDADSFVQFAAALRVPLNEDSLEPTRPAQLERDIPGSVTWSMRHATALGAGIAIVLIAVVLFAVGLSSGPSHR